MKTTTTTTTTNFPSHTESDKDFPLGSSRKDRLTNFSDWDGSLVPIEFSRLPFIPKRVFYVTGVPINERRGGHAHFKTLQYLVCIKGKIIVELDFGNQDIRSITLFPNEGLLVNTLVWDEQIFCSGNDVLMAFCNTPYEKSDYIEDKGLFYNLINKSSLSIPE